MSRLDCYDLMARLAEARRRAGLSQRALAQAAGVAHPTVWRMEQGLTMPAVDTLERLARALGVSAGWLAYGCGPMEAGAEERSVPAPEEQVHAEREALVSATVGLCEAS